MYVVLDGTVSVLESLVTEVWLSRSCKLGISPDKYCSQLSQFKVFFHPPPKRAGMMKRIKIAEGNSFPILKHLSRKLNLTLTL